MTKVLKSLKTTAAGEKGLAFRSGTHVTALLTFAASQGAPWWGLLIGGVVLTSVEMFTNRSKPS